MYRLESLKLSKIFFFTSSKAGIALLGKLRPREVIALLQRHTRLAPAPSAFQSDRELLDRGKEWWNLDARMELQARHEWELLVVGIFGSRSTSRRKPILICVKTIVAIAKHLVDKDIKRLLDKWRRTPTESEADTRPELCIHIDHDENTALPTVKTRTKNCIDWKF